MGQKYTRIDSRKISGTVRRRYWIGSLMACTVSSGGSFCACGFLFVGWFTGKLLLVVQAPIPVRSSPARSLEDHVDQFVSLVFLKEVKQGPVEILRRRWL